MSWKEQSHGHDGSIWLYSKYSLDTMLFKSNNGNLKRKQTLLSQWECILESRLSRLLKHLKQQGETIILTLKSAINLKSTECRELKTEDTFCVIFIWLISSYHLNLILWCHWRVVFVLSLPPVYLVFFLCFFLLCLSTHLSLPSHSPVNLDSFLIFRRNKSITTMLQKNTFTVKI